MPIVVQCDNCRRRFGAPDTALGKTAACPNCGNQITIKPLAEVQRVSPPTPKGVAEARHQTSSSKAVLIVLSAVVAAAVLAVVGFLTLARDKSDPAVAKSVLDRGAKPERIEEGLGLTLEQFKRDVPVGESWKVLSDTKREDGTVSFQLISTTMRYVALIVTGNPNDLHEVAVVFTATTGDEEGDTLAKMVVMAQHLAKYSNWTEGELGLLWGWLLEVGAWNESKIRLQKNGHEFWVVPMGVKDGTMFMTGVVVKPDSTAPTLQAWLEDHLEPVGAGLNKSSVSHGLVTNASFSFKGLRHKGGGNFIGEMTNDSNQNCISSSRPSRLPQKASCFPF